MLHCGLLVSQLLKVTEDEIGYIMEFQIINPPKTHEGYDHPMSSEIPYTRKQDGAWMKNRFEITSM